MSLRALGVPHRVLARGDLFDVVQAIFFPEESSEGLRRRFEAKDEEGQRKDDEVLGALAEHVEDCRFLVFDDAAMTCRKIGASRSRVRRSAILCASGSEYVAVGVPWPYAVVMRTILADTHGPVSVSKCLIRTYLASFGIGLALGSVLMFRSGVPMALFLHRHVSASLSGGARW